MDLEFEKILEKRKHELDLDIDKQQKLEIDKIYMEKQRSISEGVREIEKVRDQALRKKIKQLKLFLLNS